MARYTASRWTRLGLGTAMFAAGIALFVARPGIALAHHVMVTETGSCAGWESKGEYIGGTGDRKVVVDVTINGEHITGTFYFDNAPGHLGHQDYYLLYDRSGTGALHSSGTVVMYEKSGAAYTVVASSGSPNTNVDCGTRATSTPTATATVIATSTNTPAPATNTPIATSTVVVETATSTSVPSTPTAAAPTATATTGVTTGENVTPLASATRVITPATPTPESPRTTETTRGLVTPGPQSTPTLVDTVLSSRRPGDSIESAPPVDRALPATGQGRETRGAILAGLLGTAIAAIGLAVCGTGLRARKTS